MTQTRPALLPYAGALRGVGCEEPRTRGVRVSTGGSVWSSGPSSICVRNHSKRFSPTQSPSEPACSPHKSCPRWLVVFVPPTVTQAPVSAVNIAYPTRANDRSRLEVETTQVDCFGIFCLGVDVTARCPSSPFIQSVDAVKDMFSKWRVTVRQHKVINIY